MKIHIDHGHCGPFLNEKGCNACLTICPLGVFLSAPQPLPLRPGQKIDRYKVFPVQPNICILCGKCREVCPSGAIKLSGE